MIGNEKKVNRILQKQEKEARGAFHPGSTNQALTGLSCGMSTKKIKFYKKLEKKLKITNASF